MNVLLVALVQTDIIWENPAGNRQLIDNKLQGLVTPVDLIVLPEMFSTGFTMDPEPHAESMDGPSIVWMQKKAKDFHSAITGSLIISENGNYYNRMIWMHPDGEINYYNKRHLFCYAGEHKKYTAGRERSIVEYKGWNICLNICYDLRFPVWSRNLNDYDILVNVANWPEARISHWNCLLRARAIENMSYVLGLNRVGIDGNGIKYSGESALIRYDGDVMKTKKGEEAILRESINKYELLDYREKLRFLKDADRFDVIL